MDVAINIEGVVSNKKFIKKMAKKGGIQMAEDLVDDQSNPIPSDKKIKDEEDINEIL